jgi:hypothetical protein
MTTETLEQTESRLAEQFRRAVEETLRDAAFGLEAIEDKEHVYRGLLSYVHTGRLCERLDNLAKVHYDTPEGLVSLNGVLVECKGAIPGSKEIKLQVNAYNTEENRSVIARLKSPYVTVRGSTAEEEVPEFEEPAPVDQLDIERDLGGFEETSAPAQEETKPTTFRGYPFKDLNHFIDWDKANCSACKLSPDHVIDGAEPCWWQKQLEECYVDDKPVQPNVVESIGYTPDAERLWECPLKQPLAANGKKRGKKAKE